MHLLVLERKCYFEVLAFCLVLLSYVAKIYTMTDYKHFPTLYVRLLLTQCNGLLIALGVVAHDHTVRQVPYPM